MHVAHDIDHLIDFEQEYVRYQSPLPGAAVGFRIYEGQCPVVVSAPHGARCFRPGDPDDYHQEDEYTAALSEWLHARVGASAICMVQRSRTDPNFTDNCPYKTELASLVERSRARFVLDIHGAVSTREFAIDLGCGGATHDEVRSCAGSTVEQFKRLWFAEFPPADTVSVNHFPGRREGTVTRFIMQHFRGTIPVMQIEINGKYRIPRRKTDATASEKPFPAPGDQLAQYRRISGLMRTLRSFVHDMSQGPPPSPPAPSARYAGGMTDAL